MTFLLACGGSGGHIFPAISVGEELKSRYPEAEIIYACGTKDIENEIFKIVPKESVFPLESAPFRGAFSFFDPRFLLKLTKGFLSARTLLKKIKPAIVVGFGGYVSFPMLSAAKCMGIKTALHEQNVVPGRANRVLAKFVDAVALSHEESLGKFGALPFFRVTGNPIRASIENDCREQALEFFGFSASKKTLLVLGGSQGAESVNRFFLSCFPYLNPDLRNQIQVLHLCGSMDPKESEKQCREAGLFARAFSFFDKMDLAYGVTDLCVGRAGATFLAEIEVKRIPAILIPYPFADGHQRENAKVFSRHSAAAVVEQSDLTPEILADLIQQMFSKIENSFFSSLPSTPRNARFVLTDFLTECAKR